MPNTTLFPTKNVAEEVVTALGASGLDVELVEKDVERALRDALRLYNRNRPGRHTKALAVTSAQKRYILPQTAAGFLGIQGVTDVETVTPRVTDGIDPFDPLSVIGPGGISTGIDTFGDYDQKLHYIEQARRIASSEFEWKFQWEPNPLGVPVNVLVPVLYVDVPATTPLLCSVTYTIHYTFNGVAITGLQNIPDGDTDWFIDWCTAFCKTILSRIRGKFKGITGPDGSDQPVDYDDLMTEGREELTRLREAITKRRRPLPPVLE